MKLTMLLQYKDDEFGQFRVETWSGAGFLTLKPEEAQTLAALMIFGARASGDDVEYEERYFDENTRTFA